MKNKISRVFLGGTCNNSTWRNRMMIYLDYDGLDYFNPVVDDWTVDCQERELEERQNCDFCLYVITPLMTGVYSIAEVIDDSNKRPEKVVLVVLNSDKNIVFSDAQLKSLGMVSNMVVDNGGKSFDNLKSASNYIKKMDTV